MQNLIIRAAKSEDLDFIVQANGIINQHSHLKNSANLKTRLQKDFFSKSKSKSQANLLIAELDTRPIGMALYSACYFMNEGECIWLSNIYVDEKFRGKGVAQKLLEKIKEMGRFNQCPSVGFLEDIDNKSAQAFAIKNGATSLNNLRFYSIDI